MRALCLFALSASACAAGPQELWHFGNPNPVYGVYRKEPDPINPRNYFEKRVGHIDTKVTDDVYEGRPCKRYKSTAFFSAKPGTPGAVPTVRYVECWIAEDGLPLRVHMQYSAFRKAIATDARFKGDEIELTITENARTRTATLFASGGAKAFVNPILGLIRMADKDRPVAEFSLLDPSSAGILKYTARVIGKFTADVQGKKMAGRTLEVVGKEGRLVFYVTDEQELIQVDLPDGATVTAQQFFLLPDGKTSKLNVPPP